MCNVYNMIGTILQQQYRMLKEENNPSHTENKKQNDSSSENDSQQNMDDHFVDNFSHDYQEQNNKNLSSAHIVPDDFDQLVGIFYELVTLVNKHSKLINNNNSLNNNVNPNNQALLAQNIGLNRIISKRKSTKPSKTTTEPTKTIKEAQRPKIIHKRQSLPISKQVLSEANRKNSTLFPDVKNNIELPNGDLNANAKRKSSIFKNYSQIMEYHIHFSEDDAQPSPNLLGSNRIKARNPQRSISEYSFAHSSRNVEQKQKRKLSIERSVEIVVKPQQHNLLIYPQFQITQNNRDITIINYSHLTNHSRNSE